MAGVRRLEVQEATWHDDRGWGINPLEAAALPRESLANLHVVSTKPGTIRGNHYHSSATEWMLVCGGPAKVVWQSSHEDSIREVLTSGAEPVLFEIPPNVVHAVMNDSNADIYVLSFSNSYDRGTVPCPLVFESAEKKG